MLQRKLWIRSQFTPQLWENSKLGASHVRILSLPQNAEKGGIPHFEHDDSLYLEKREEMVYNTESRTRVEGRYELPSRSEMLRQPFHHPNSKYQSSLMARRDPIM